MGVVADNVELSRNTLQIRSFREWFDRPGFLTAKDLPYIPPKEPALLEKAERIIAWTQGRIEQAHEEGFVDRTQSGFPVWAGPPGLPETRPIVTRPEGAGGDIFNWVA